MDLKTKTRIEYEHQFFGFSSDSILDSYKEMLRDTIYDTAINSMVKMLKKKLVAAAEDEKTLERGLEEMAETLKCNYSRGVDYAMTTIESKVRECFHIPDNILLPEDQIVSTVENIDPDTIDNEITELKQELKNIAYMMEEVKEEQIIADKTIEVLKDADSIQICPLPKSLH